MAVYAERWWMMRGTHCRPRTTDLVRARQASSRTRDELARMEPPPVGFPSPSSNTSFRARSV